jgi:hypothetical protein
MMKKYLEFIKEEKSGYEYGCVMVDFNFTNWSKLLESIDSDDIYKVEGKSYGLQPRSHLTLLYGIHDTVSDEEILNCFKGFKEDDFKVQLDGVSIFENTEFDVVKFGVVLTPKLKEINKRLSELPNSNQFPEYKPHITLAYVKKGLGKKCVVKIQRLLANPDYKYEIKTISKIVYTRPDTTELNIQL